MSLAHSPSIVTSGLVMYVDAANIKSYPGSGATWFDMSGNGNHLTLTGSPVFTSNIVQFNGTTQYADNTLNLSTGTSTIFAASRYSGAINGRVITSKTNNWLLGHWSSTVANYYAAGWVTAIGAGGLDTNWRIYAGTADVTAVSYNFYINGSLNTSGATGTAGPNGISVGRFGGGTEYSTCEVSFVMAYNRVLTAAEVLQNYTALSGRFGI